MIMKDEALRPQTPKNDPKQQSPPPILNWNVRTWNPYPLGSTTQIVWSQDSQKIQIPRK